MPAIAVEWSGARRLGEILAARFMPRRAIVVTDRGVRGAGLLHPVLASLSAAGFTVGVFDGVVADPPEAVVHACVEQARGSGADIVIGLGGGSSLDIAKLCAVLVASDQPLDGMYGIGRVQGERLPLVLIPTTAGTGSEVTNISVITTGETTKMGVVARQLFADFALLDAELTVGLPVAHTAATGIDAMVHAIEAYTSKVRKNPISDALAREAFAVARRQSYRRVPEMARIVARARRCCSVRCWRDRLSPMRRWRRCTLWPIRSAVITMCRTGSRTR